MTLDQAFEAIQYCQTGDNFEEFREKLDDDMFQEPEQDPKKLVELVENVFQEGCEQLRESARYSDLLREEDLEAEHNGISIGMPALNGINGEIRVELSHEDVGVVYYFEDADDDETYSERITANDAEGIEKALDFAFGRYQQIWDEKTRGYGEL